MIKRINYVWLGGNPLPPGAKACIKSWRKFCPNFEIVEWNESNLPINHSRWVKEALSEKKWSFAGDYLRMLILYQYGGVYMDTDVQLYAPIEKYLTDKFVSGIENHYYGTGILENNITEDGFFKGTTKNATGFCIQVGFMYAEPYHPFIKSFLTKFYNDGQRAFINNDNSNNAFIPDEVMARFLKDYGLKFRDRTQKLPDGITLYDSSIFSTRKSKGKNTVAIHWYDQSWNDKGLKQKMKNFIKKYLWFIYRKQ